MKNLVRNLSYYGYDDDSTMFKEDSANRIFAISKIKEQKNKKYIKTDEDE